MKNIENYHAKKYPQKGFFSKWKKQNYRQIEDGIYEYQDNGRLLYVTSLSFEQEPEYGEGDSAANISQYPLEDILDQFYCHISDFYEDLNLTGSAKCYLEFAAMGLDDVQNLRSIIGRHVYNQEYEEDGKSYIRLVIE